MIAWVAMSAAGALGALARFHGSRLVVAPWGTFAVNLTGAFVLGLLWGAGVRGDAYMICGTGFLGGYTTFSTWMVETLRAERPIAVVYLGASLVCGLAASALGWVVGAAL